MWDATQEAQDAQGCPAATLVSVASGRKRHTTRRTSRAKTTKLGRLQRRIIVDIFKRMWEAGHERGELGEDWVRWVPKHHVDEVTPASSASASKALKALEKRRLMLVRRNDGGRAHTVRLSDAGLDYAMRELDGTHAKEARRRLRSANLPAAIRRSVPKFYVELRSSSTDSERRAALQAFTEAYGAYLDSSDAEDYGLLERLIALRKELTS